MHGAVGSIHLLQALADVLQADSSHTRDAFEEERSGFFRGFILDDDAEVILMALRADEDEAALGTTGDAVLDGVFDERLQDETRDEGMGDERVDVPADDEAVAEADGLDGEIFLGNGELVGERNLVEVGGVEGAAQQAGELADHLGGGVRFVAEDERGDGVHGVEEEVRLELITEGAELGFLGEYLGGDEAALIFLEREVVLDAEVEGDPGHQGVPAAGSGGDDVDPAEGRADVAEVQGGFKGAGSAEHAEGEGGDHADEGRDGER